MLFQTPQASDRFSREHGNPRRSAGILTYSLKRGGRGTDEVRYDDKPTMKDTVKGCEIKKPVS